MKSACRAVCCCCERCATLRVTCLPCTLSPFSWFEAQPSPSGNSAANPKTRQPIGAIRGFVSTAANRRQNKPRRPLGGRNYERVHPPDELQSARPCHP